MGTNVISKLKSKTMQKKEINKTQWRLLVWSLIIIGALAFCVFSSTFFMPKEYLRTTGYAALGSLLVGGGFGLAYARAFKIKGIDE